MKHCLLLLFTAFFCCNIAYSQNHSVNFDGTDDYIQTTSPGLTGTAARTVEAWVKTSWNGTQRVILDMGQMTPNGSRYTVNMINGGLRIEVGGNGVTTSTLINNGSWHHIATTYDNSLATNKHKLYIDGNFIVGSNLTVAVNTLTGNIIIGRRNDGINYWQGNIDEVRVWNVARTDAEIAANMNTELSGTEAGLIFYAKMDETMASCDVVDCSAGQNHGTRLGSTGANNTAQYSTDVPSLTDIACAICLTNCNLGTCSISGLSVTNISGCNDNGTSSDPGDDFFTADVTVDFMGEPGTGSLDLSGSGSASIAVGSLSGCSHTFTGVQMSANGSAINLTASFSANTSCTFTNSNAGTAPAACSSAPPPPPPACSISAITVSNISGCDDGGTNNNTGDDTFTADVTVNFSGPPATGTLNIIGDGSASVSVGAIGTSSYTFTGVTMQANGGPISLSAFFSASASCSLSNNNAGTAPASCSPNAPTIPTMSEWGLILFSLIIFTISLVLGTREKHALALQTEHAEMSSGSFRIPFDKDRYFRILPFVYLGFTLVFGCAVTLFGYEMTTADLPGSLLTGLVITYLIQFAGDSSLKK